MTIDENLKLAFGELVFANAIMKTQLEEAQKRITELEAQALNPVPRVHKTNIQDLMPQANGGPPHEQ